MDIAETVYWTACRPAPVTTNLNIVATSVEKGDVDDRFFQHPVGINAEMDAEADAMANGMAKQVVAMLKDPEKGQVRGATDWSSRKNGRNAGRG